MKDNHITYVTFETAKLAQQKGFDWPCSQIYNTLGDLWQSHYATARNSNRESGMKCTAPTQPILQKWLREVFQLHVEIYANGSGWGWILTRVAGSGTVLKEIEDFTFLESYEKALEDGLQIALNYEK